MDKIGRELLTFDAAQYLPKEWGPCHNLHGHTYLMKDLTIWVDQVVNVVEMKRIIDQFDHLMLIPEMHLEYWRAIQTFSEGWCKSMAIEQPCTFKLMAIPYEMVTMENLKRYFITWFFGIKGVKKVYFKLYETPQNWVEVEC
jgi:6-pyruvoyl-tetrahydropterin synthase